MSGRFPNIRYQDSYDSFKYDDVLKTEIFDFVKIRGDKGIINQNISDFVIDGGMISKQGIKVGRAKIGSQQIIANNNYSSEFAGTISYNKEDDELVIVRKDGTAFDMLHANVELDSANISGLLTADRAIIHNDLNSNNIISDFATINSNLVANMATINVLNVPDILTF